MFKTKYNVLIILVFCQASTIFSQCTDTVLCTPTLNNLIKMQFEKRQDGFYINQMKVEKEEYIWLTKLHVDATDFFNSKLKQGCYFIFFDKDSIKSYEAQLGPECYMGIYKSFHKNGTIKEEGNYNPEVCNAKTGRWKYYNEQGNLIREEEFSKEGVLLKKRKIPQKKSSK